MERFAEKSDLEMRIIKLNLQESPASALAQARPASNLDKSWGGDELSNDDGTEQQGELFEPSGLDGADQSLLDSVNDLDGSDLDFLPTSSCGVPDEMPELAALQNVSKDIGEATYFNILNEVPIEEVFGLSVFPGELLSKMPRLNIGALKSGMEFSFFVNHNKETTTKLTDDNLGHWHKKGANHSSTSHYYFDGDLNQGTSTDYTWKLTRYASKHPHSVPLGSLERRIWKASHRINGFVGCAIVSYRTNEEFSHLNLNDHGDDWRFGVHPSANQHNLVEIAKVIHRAPPRTLPHLPSIDHRMLEGVDRNAVTKIPVTDVCETSKIMGSKKVIRCVSVSDSNLCVMLATDAMLERLVSSSLRPKQAIREAKRTADSGKLAEIYPIYVHTAYNPNGFYVTSFISRYQYAALFITISKNAEDYRLMGAKLMEEIEDRRKFDLRALTLVTNDGKAMLALKEVPIFGEPCSHIPYKLFQWRKIMTKMNDLQIDDVTKRRITRRIFGELGRNRAVGILHTTCRYAFGRQVKDLISTIPDKTRASFVKNGLESLWRLANMQMRHRSRDLIEIWTRLGKNMVENTAKMLVDLLEENGFDFSEKMMREIEKLMECPLERLTGVVF